MTHDCNHKWKDVPKEDSRSYQDRTCVYCGIKEMQNAMTMPLTEPLSTENSEKHKRYTINLGKDTQVSISREEIQNKIKDELHQGIRFNSIISRHS